MGPADDYDGGKFALIWYNPKDDMFYVATKASDVASEYAVFTTDGVAERVYTDANADANWGQTQITDAKGGDKDFFGGGTPQSYAAGFADTADLYTITKIWKAEETRTTDASAYTVSGPIAAMEDKFRITVDKSINWDGSIYADPDGDGTSNTGYVQVIKFTPATTGTFTYVSQCSNRGLCNTDDALCECFKGYTNDN